jgi:hypothetical protein
VVGSGNANAYAKLKFEYSIFCSSGILIYTVYWKGTCGPEAHVNENNQIIMIIDNNNNDNNDLVVIKFSI